MGIPKYLAEPTIMRSFHPIESRAERRWERPPVETQTVLVMLRWRPVAAAKDLKILLSFGR